MHATESLHELESCAGQRAARNGELRGTESCAGRLRGTELRGMERSHALEPGLPVRLGLRRRVASFELSPAFQPRVSNELRSRAAPATSMRIRRSRGCRLAMCCDDA